MATPATTGSAPSAADQAAANQAASQQAAANAQASEVLAREQAARIAANSSAQPQGGHAVNGPHWTTYLLIGIGAVLAMLLLTLCVLAYRMVANNTPVANQQNTVVKNEENTTTPKPEQKPQGPAPASTPEVLPAPASQPAPLPGAPAPANQQAAPGTAPQGQQPVIYQQAPVYTSALPAPGLYSTGTVEASDATVLSFRKSACSDDVLYVGPGRHLPRKVYAASCPMQIVQPQVNVPVQVDAHFDCPQGGPVPPQKPTMPQEPNPPAPPVFQAVPKQAPAPAPQQTFAPAAPGKKICQRHPFN